MFPEREEPTSIINFEEVIRFFWPRALRAIHDWNTAAADQRGFAALAERNLETRQEDIRQWLRSYGVFRGLGAVHWDGIGNAVLRWADQRCPNRDLTTADALAEAHGELMQAVREAYPNHRDFTSLASKALWLCYPDRVPIFDSYAKRALQVISKLERDIAPIPNQRPEYHQFVHVWMQLYTRYKGTIEQLDMDTYDYRVRVFDVILWLIGRPCYGRN